jgi:hypothetical protein
MYQINLVEINYILELLYCPIIQQRMQAIKKLNTLLENSNKSSLDYFS